MASLDGLNWNTVYRRTAIPESDAIQSSTNIMGVVWDAGRFWATAYEANEYYGEVDGHAQFLKGENIEILLSSETGMSWSEAGTRTAVWWDNGMTGVSLPDQGMMAAHCRDLVKDVYGNGVPDGLYYYNFENDTEISIIPDWPEGPPYISYSGGSIGFNAPANTISISIITSTESKSYSASPGIPIYAVGYASGIIVAAGGTTAGGTGRGETSYAVSTDMGKTWSTGSFFGYPPALAVCGAPNVVRP